MENQIVIVEETVKNRTSRSSSQANIQSNLLSKNRNDVLKFANKQNTHTNATKSATVAPIPRNTTSTTVQPATSYECANDPPSWTDVDALILHAVASPDKKLYLLVGGDAPEHMEDLKSSHEIDFWSYDPNADLPQFDYVIVYVDHECHHHDSYSEDDSDSYSEVDSDSSMEPDCIL